MIKLIRERPGSYAEDKEGLEAYAILGDWTEMMKTQQRGGRAMEVSAMVAFSSFRKMLDPGGGPGLLGIAIVNRHPELRAVIFDTPKECNLENRVEVMTGDYLKDSIGEGYDFILAIGTLNFAKHDLDLAVKKIYDALNPNGVFMCISEGLTHEATRSKEMVVSWLPSVLKGFDFRLKQGTVSMFTGDMDVDIAKK